MAEKILTNVQADYPDQRDWIYRPPLIELPERLASPENLHILNQRQEGACTGMALAAAVNILKRGIDDAGRASERMLYDMARRHDEWAGEGYEGSSLRGAIHGFKQMGVCSRGSWPFKTNPAHQGDLTIDRAKEARSTTLGAYYRLRPVVSDYHAALSETGVVVASSRYHRGWAAPLEGTIIQAPSAAGGHAFAIIGYDEDGFWIQNSWGSDWGDNGCALWRYEDWIENGMDAWVFRLALPTPQIFGRRPMASKLIGAAEQPQSARTAKSPTRRDAIAGHFVHIDDGRFDRTGRYWSTPFDVQETADLVAKSNKYDNIVFYAHGGLNTPKDSAERIVAMKQVFKDNRIYPYHIMYDTGLAEELRDLILAKNRLAVERVGGVGDWLDRTVEHVIRRPGKLIWDEMKQDAKDAFSAKGAGTIAIKKFKTALRAANAIDKRLHLVAHSAGAVLFAHMLKALRNQSIAFDTCSLMAPACTIDLYDRTYLPVLQGKTKLDVANMYIYNLADELELDDHVLSDQVYRKSLLYLVSNALESDQGAPLLGMARDKAQLHGVGNKPKQQPQVHYSNGVSSTRTRSSSHGEFDNDVYTMNHILRSILGGRPKRAFTEQDLVY